MTDALQSGFWIGDWEVYPQENRLKGPNRECVLEPKVMDVLVLLARRQGDVVSRRQILDSVWAGVVVGDEVVSRAVSLLRTELGDDQKNPRYLKTISKRGYCLIADVTLVSSNEPQQAESVSDAAASTTAESPSDSITHRTLRKLSFTIVTVLALALAYFAYGTFVLQPESDDSAGSIGGSIAVMPFANLSAESSNQFFADGIHDDLLTRISNIQDIKTISRTSMMTYRNSDKNLRSIAKELGVNTILEGAVQRSGDQVRINLQLIDAESDAHLWAHTYTRELTATNVFEIQAEITESVAGALQTILSADEQQQIDKLPTANLQALDAYYLGNQLFDQATSKSVGQAISAYEAAIRFDPEFALAYSKQAAALLAQVYRSGLPTKAQLEISRPLIDQAILLDPQSSEAFSALGDWYRHSGDTEKASKAYEQAIALGPNNADALARYGSILQSEMSDPASAIKLYRRAVDLDPQNIGLKRQLARAMPSVGRADEGIQMLEGIIAQHPESAAGYRDLASLYSNWEFRHDKGIRVLRRAFELDPNHPPNSFFNAIMHWRLADYDNTALWMNNIARLVPDPERARVYRGWALIAQGDFESAREEFDRPTIDDGLYWLGVFYLGSVDTAEGRPDDAIERYTEYAAEFDGSKSNVNFYFGIAAIKAYKGLGEQGKAQALIDELISIINANPPATYHDSAIHDASLYALSGQEDAAIAILEEWADRGGATSLVQQDIRHGLSVLADDPRYQFILRTIGNRLSKQKTNLARWEASGEMLPMPREVADPR